MKILLNVVYSSTLEKWQYNKKKKETEKARIQVQNRKNKKGKKNQEKIKGLIHSCIGENAVF